MLNRILWILVFLLFFYGTSTGLRKGGEDFRVFHHAAVLVLQGQGSEIYSNSPDRFLYAPGIAWLFSPLGLLTWQKSFLVWTGLKFLALLGTLNVLSRRYGETAAYLAVLFFARPFLIEVRYGQVNLFIVYASLIALDVWCAARPAGILREAWSWTQASIATLMKLFPGAVLLVPFFGLLTERRGKAFFQLFIAATAGTLLIFAPTLTEEISRILPLHLGWVEALKAKGFPLETHNQSFTAFLLHVFSGNPYYSLTLGPSQTGTVFGSKLLSEATIYRLGFGVGLAVIVALIAASYRIARTRSFYWAPYLIAGLILPSHLVWKPYFVLGIPLVAQLISFSARSPRKGSLRALLAVLALVMNLSTLDVIGARGTAYFEAYAGFLWVYLVLIALGLIGLRRFSEGPLSGKDSEFRLIS